VFREARTKIVVLTGLFAQSQNYTPYRHTDQSYLVFAHAHAQLHTSVRQSTMINSDRLITTLVHCSFELHARQRMPGPLTYFPYLVGPMLLWKTWVQRAPHLFFCNSITVFTISVVWSLWTYSCQLIQCIIFKKMFPKVTKCNSRANHQAFRSSYPVSPSCYILQHRRYHHHHHHQQLGKVSH